MAEQNPPPLPLEVDQPPLPPEPQLLEEVPNPPMPMHMSNQKQKWLDFDGGDGGRMVRQAQPDAGAPAAKRPRLDVTGMPQAEGETEPCDDDLSKNLVTNIEVANAMLAAIANEIKSEDSPGSVEDGEVLSSDNETVTAKQERTPSPGSARFQMSEPVIKQEPTEQHTPSAISCDNACLSGENVNLPNKTIKLESSLNKNTVSTGSVDNKSQTEEESHSNDQSTEPQSKKERANTENTATAPDGDQEHYTEDPHTKQRDFCPYDVGSHRKPVSQIPVAPPNNELPEEFEIIDDLPSEEEEASSDSEGEVLDPEEIEKMLDEGLVHYTSKGELEFGKESPSQETKAPDDPNAPIERPRIVLKEIRKDPFDILPEGWICVTHNSGIPIYLHRQLRVVSVTRPYFLGKGSVRKHHIPLSAIPCLHFLREREEKFKEQSSCDKETNQTETESTEKQHHTDGAVVNGISTTSNKVESSEITLNKDSDNPEPTVSSAPEKGTETSNSTDANNTTSENNSESPMEVTGQQVEGDEADSAQKSIKTVQEQQPASELPEKGVGPDVKIDSVEKYQKEKTLAPSDVYDYCTKLFTFETITVKKYRTWKDRRIHQKKTKGQPSLPSNTKLITCPILAKEGAETTSKGAKKKEFILNPTGKSEICILHEYVQHALKVQPKYIYKELENSQTPYSATVMIEGVAYGTGYASSKKHAKNEAAKESLGILVPQLRKATEQSKAAEMNELEFFDEVKIEDPRVHDLCNKAGQPSPFQILCECLRRNFGMGNTSCQTSMKALKHQRSEFTMTVGKHQSSVICKNKREGKQLAAQGILQKLHPYITCWGSLLRLYGTNWKAIKEKQEEQSVTALHANAKQHQPNYSILKKLREEMLKLQMRREYVGCTLMDGLDLARNGATWRTDIHSLYDQLMMDLPLVRQTRKRQLSRPHRDTSKAADLQKTSHVVEGSHSCKYRALLKKLDGWVKVATHKLVQVKSQVETKSAEEVKGIQIEKLEEVTVTEKVKGQSNGTSLSEGNVQKLPINQETCTTPVKMGSQCMAESVNEYGTRIEPTPKESPEGQMTAIKPRVEYKVGTASKRETRPGSFGFDGSATVPRLGMGAVKQDLEGNILNKPVGMFSVVQRLNTEPEKNEMAQHEDMMHRVREAEEETRRVTAENQKLKEEINSLGLGLCGRDGQIRKPGEVVPPAVSADKRDAFGGGVMMEIDSDTDGGFILEVNKPRCLHTATQTDWVGKSQFHKATQFPITHYSSDEMRSMSADLVPVKKASLYSGESVPLHVSTQTEWLGHKTMHKAIQFPDVAYSKEDGKTGLSSAMAGMVPTMSPTMAAVAPPVLPQWQPIAEVPTPCAGLVPKASTEQKPIAHAQTMTKMAAVLEVEAPTSTVATVKEEPGEEVTDKIIIPKVSTGDNQTVAQAVQSVVTSPPVRPMMGAGTFMYPQYAQAMYTPYYNQAYYMPQYSYPQYQYVMMGGTAVPRAPGATDGENTDK